jgi:UPF0755 protein
MKKIIILLTTAVLLLTAMIYFGVKAYHIFFRHNITAEEPGYVLYIRTGATYDEVINKLISDRVLKDIGGFEWLAKRLKYPQNVRPGRYVLTKEMTNKDIIRKLRIGDQDPVKVHIGKFRTKPDLVGFFSEKLETDSLELLALLNDTAFLEKHSLTPETAISIFLSDSYEFFWNTSAQQLIERMLREYENFWTSGRIEKASDQGLSPVEAIIVASIVEEETNNDEEKPRIAGVYLNRIRKGIKLQADPTVKFAVQNFTLRRVLTRHVHYDSPYNTYIYEGLPPGPICIPSKKSIAAVLDAETHDYIFFCANGDGSGTHLFAETYKEHQNNARKYRRMLNENGIF